jgi:hypothetical protein
MLEKIKSLLSKYKIHVTVVGGALVAASVYGQCTFEPNVDTIEEAAEKVETNPVSTTEEGTTEAAIEITETTSVTTTDTTAGDTTGAAGTTATGTTTTETTTD